MLQFFKNLKRPQHADLFWVAIGTAFALIVFNQVLIQYMLYQKSSDALVINVAGRQRMLSQKVAVLFYEASENPAQVPVLRNTIWEWRQAHQHLLYGNAAQCIPACVNPKILLQLLQTEQNIRVAGFATDSLMHQHPVDLAQIANNQSVFLQRMESIVSELQADSDHTLRLLVLTEIMLALFSLFVLVGEFLFVYKPVLDQLYAQKKIIESENEQNLAIKNKLLAILNSTSDANILIGLQYEILSINKTAVRLLKKYFGKEPVEQQSILGYIVPADLEAFKTNYTEAILGKTTKLRKKMHFPSASCWFELAYSPVYNDQGQIIGVSFNAKDIQVAQSRFERLQEISWTHSHELRRPVSNIMGLMQMVEWEKLDDENKELFKHFDTVAKDLDRVIHKVVGVSNEKEGVIPI
jgi:PAS domain-containing protein